jgi:hypothetical protein
MSKEPRISHRFPWWLRPFLQRGVVGITLGRRIYLSAKLEGDALQRFTRHELVHVEQINRIGLLRFYWRYMREYVSLRRSGLKPFEAYPRISFEQEASAAEELV